MVVNVLLVIIGFVAGMLLKDFVVDQIKKLEDKNR